jgi:hypothetical protein
MESFEEFMVTAEQSEEVESQQKSDSEKKANEKPVNDLGESNYQEFISDGNFHFVKFCKINFNFVLVT